MSILQEIYEGWKNYTFKSPHVERIAKKRAEICVNCVIGDQSGMKPNKTCRFCGCYVPAKVRSLRSKCPKGKW